MRAIVVDRPGGPEVLRLSELTPPSPGTGELLVRTGATGVNFIETYQRSGLYSVEPPFTPGAEASGWVIEVGDDVTGFEPGDLVTTAEARATYAEQFVVAAEGAVPVPAGIAERDDAVALAAALPLQGLTAHYLASSVARPEVGETVLVHAGAGGVGLLLTQLLVARGVQVLTTASTPEKRALSESAGAARVLGYEGFAEAAREFTDGEGVAVVYDGVGKDTFDESLAALRVRGELVLFGASSGPVPPFDPQRLRSGGSLLITRPSLDHFLRTADERAWRYGDLFGAVESGKLRLRIGARFPLAEAGRAHTALESRATTGKVILES